MKMMNESDIYIIDIIHRIYKYHCNNRKRMYKLMNKLTFKVHIYTELIIIKKFK